MKRIGFLTYFSVCIISMVRGHAFADTSANVGFITHFANSDAQIETTCLENSQAANRCAVAIKKEGSTRFLLHFPFPPTNIGLSGQIFSILFPCGTGCSATFFYSQTLGLSKPYSLVLAVNTKIGMVLSASTDALYVYEIFPKTKRASAPVARIKLDTSPTSDNMQSLSAIADGNGFTVRYAREDGKEKVIRWKNTDRTGAKHD